MRTTDTTTLGEPARRSGLLPDWVGREVVTILAVQLVFGFGWSLYLLMPKYLTTALAAGPDFIGRTSAAAGLAAVLTVPFAATGLDRWGRVRFFRAGAALIVCLSVGFLQVREADWHVYVLQGMVAMSFVLAFNASGAMLVDWAPPERLGQAVSWLGAANVLMNAVATMVAEPLAARHGWGAVFELGIGAGLAAFVLSFAMREAPARARPVAVATDAIAVEKRSDVGAILFAAILIGAVFSAMFQFVQPYALSLGAREVRGFFLGFTASAVTCRLFFGSLGDRRGRRRVSAFAFVGYAFCAVASVRLDPGWLVAYGFVFGTAHGVLYPTMSALVLEVLPPARRGLAMVLYNGAFNVGAAAGGFAWGILAEHHGYPALYATAAATALFGSGVLVLGGRRRNTIASLPA